MLSHIITTTLQAATLSAVSNLAAQGIKAYREEVSGQTTTTTTRRILFY